MKTKNKKPSELEKFKASLIKDINELIAENNELLERDDLEQETYNGIENETELYQLFKTMISNGG